VGEVIQADGLVKRFGNTLAVDGLSLSVEEGEIFGLVGPDGVGKSTTIRMLSTLLEPDAGTARVLGYDVVGQAHRIRGHLGYMAQQFNLYGAMTVAENLEFFADIYGVRGNERSRRLDELLEFSRLGPFLDRRAGQLSGGMKQKLALACNLVHSPGVLFLDEPTTGVDPVSRREFWRILSELHAGGTTLFIATPYMDEAERCHRVGFMNSGRLTVLAAPTEIIEMGRQALDVYAEPLRAAHRVLESLRGVGGVSLFGDHLVVARHGGSPTPDEVRAALEESRVMVSLVRESTPSMESAFIELAQKDSP
jgi:ABC-2 type transport system ATP-binding protein